MADYSKTIIYEIICNDITITDCYIGSTTDFNSREQQHKKSCCDEEDDEHNYKKYVFIRDNGGWDNRTMLEIEKYPCLNNNQARERERYYYDIRNSTLNTYRPFITDDERAEEARERVRISRLENPDYMVQWRIDNVEKIKQTRKQYRIDNVDKIKKYDEEHREEANLKGKQYRIDNKEKLRIRDSKKHICECGKEGNIRHKYSHLKSLFHIQFIANKNK